MSPKFFALTDAHTEPDWPKRGAQTRLPEQSVFPVHAWSDCWLPLTALLHVDWTEARVIAEMEEGLLP